MIPRKWNCSSCLHYNGWCRKVNQRSVFFHQFQIYLSMSCGTIRNMFHNTSLEIKNCESFQIHTKNDVINCLKNWWKIIEIFDFTICNTIISKWPIHWISKLDFYLLFCSPNSVICHLSKTSTLVRIASLCWISSNKAITSATFLKTKSIYCFFACLLWVGNTFAYKCELLFSKHDGIETLVRKFDHPFRWWRWVIY